MSLIALPRRFGQVLRHLRTQHRWSQEELALRADVNRSFLGEIERGAATPTLVTMEKLARALDLPLSEILMRCEQTPQPGHALGATV